MKSSGVTMFLNIHVNVLVRGEPWNAAAWLGPMLEQKGTVVVLPERFVPAQLAWVRSLHRTGQGPRMRRWVMQLEAKGQLQPAVAAVAALAAWQQGDGDAARRWSHIGESAELGLRAVPESALTRALLALNDGDADQARAFADIAVVRWPEDPQAWLTRGCVRLQTGDGAGAAQDSSVL